MRIGRNCQKVLMLLLLSVLTIYSCRTTTATTSSTVETEIEQTLELLVLPRPVKPVMEAVRFEDRDGGLWLAYEQYRALERNIIAMREYEGKLEAVIEFYEGER